MSHTGPCRRRQKADPFVSRFCSNFRKILPGQGRARDFWTFDVLVRWHPGPATWFWNYSFDRSIKFIFDYFKPNLQFVKNYGLLQNTNSERLDLKSFEGINIFCNMGNSSCDFLCHLQTSQNHIIRILKNNSVSKDIQSNSYNKRHVLIPHTYVFFLILSSLIWK